MAATAAGMKGLNAFRCLTLCILGLMAIVTVFRRTPSLSRMMTGLTFNTVKLGMHLVLECDRAQLTLIEDNDFLIGRNLFLVGETD